MKGKLFALLVFTSTVLFAQESIIKDFAEGRRDTKLCFYPSTLRMLNISGDPSFDELVRDVEKLLVYTLDSATVASGEYKSWTKGYMENGFEEFISMSGATDLIVLGTNDEFVGITKSQGRAVAFYLRGAVNLQKIPKLIQTFEGGDVLRLLTDQINE